MKRTNLLAVLVGLAIVAAAGQEAFARARMYHPTLGRFTQRDPLGTPLEPPAARHLSPSEFTQRDAAVLDPVEPNLYAYVANNPINWVDYTGNKKEKPGKGGPTSPGTPVPGTGQPGGDHAEDGKEKPGKGGATSPETPAPGTPGFVGPPEQPAGEGATCGIRIYRSAICTLSPKKPSDFGHEWITDGTTTWDYPKNYFSDPVHPCHKYDKEHPMHIWNAHVSYWGGSLPNGTPCKKASCRQIKVCLQRAEDEWAGTPYEFWNHSCVDFATFALKKCCMAKGMLETRSPGWGEEKKACCEREKEMDRLGCNRGAGP